ncbi:response regulator [Anaerotalea alkaliphila]|uniref:Stage 0 sporulation protein A homolog n=1 Tax=Anaerotalea alkaliphila TaxID=2662126 RepID=A0A7X5HW97_9FIRM|nr:response regulator transcription factor [Anaerotalea alkaliphila]NDL67824.1 response regulator transcription factor [Anaerotalea alkaliphila]
MDDKPTILVVEDDRQIRRFIRLSLETQGYGCLETSTGTEGLSLALSKGPQVVLLDLGLPDMDGQELIGRLKSLSPAKVIIVSARGHERDKVAALDAGADDYLTKPFSVPELLARIRVALRNRATPEGEALPDTYAVRGLSIDTTRRQVLLDGEEVHLTPLEFRLLELLARYAGRVLTHKFLMDNVWGGAFEGDNQSLRVCMAGLRRKLEKDPAQPEYLLTEIGVGYRLVSE